MQDWPGSGVSVAGHCIRPGARGVDASTPIQGQNHRLGPRSSVRPRLFGQDMLTPIPDVQTPPPMPGAQLGLDFVSQQQADLKVDLLATVTWLESEVRALKLTSPIQPNPATRTQPARRLSAKFTNTEVQKFCDVTCWDQYRQVFDAIVRSNGWDDDTVALQLLSHIEGDALNVALLVPRATRIGLVSDHYGSPGDWRIIDANSVRRDGENPSIFATELETLAVKAFGDIAPSERVQMIRDRFVTDHRDCMGVSCCVGD